MKTSHITPSSLAVFFQAHSHADGEIHPDTLRFLNGRTELMFGQPISFSSDSELLEIESVIAYLLAVEFYIQNRKESESASFIKCTEEHVKNLILEARNICKESEAFIPELKIMAASKPLFSMRNKILERASQKLTTGLITAEDMYFVISITTLITDGLLDLEAEYLEAPNTHLI